MSAEDLEKYETEMELQLYREYRDIVGQFSYVVETERRFYLANGVDVQVRDSDGEVYFEVRMSDAWVWDMYRPARFVKNVRVITFKDVNVEELDKPDLRLPEEGPVRHLAAGASTPHRQSVPFSILKWAGCPQPLQLSTVDHRPLAGDPARRGTVVAMTADTTPARPGHLRTGERGEALAARYLEQTGPHGPVEELAMS